MHSLSHLNCSPSRYIQTFHDPPLIYNIEADPSENYPLNPVGADYHAAHLEIMAAKEVHEASLQPQTNEMARGVDPR